MIKSVIVAIVLMSMIIMINKLMMENKIAKEWLIIKNNLPVNGVEPIDPSINDLPASVKKWLEQSNCLSDNRRIHNISFSQKGLMNLSGDKESWHNSYANQLVNVIDPSFIWAVDVKMIPLINTKGRDIMTKGNGEMFIKLGYIMPVVNERSGRKINQSVLARFLLELPLYPSAALEHYLEWEEVSEFVAKASIEYNGYKASANYYFNEIGDIIKVEGFRYKELNENSSMKKCIGYIHNYTVVDSIRLPKTIDIAWEEDGNSHVWYKMSLENFKIKWHEEGVSNGKKN